MEQSAQSGEKFTGKERDSESGNDYFGARYYGSSMGRFLSPDPSGLLAQHPEDPQSWKLYAYSRNNPLIYLDPNGLDCIYATDNGKGVESIDHNSNSGECGQNGGTWLSGYVNENWAHFNRTNGMFEAASEDGSQVDFAAGGPHPNFGVPYISKRCGTERRMLTISYADGTETVSAGCPRSRL